MAEKDNPHPEERPFGRVSKDEGPYLGLMVRDARQLRAPYHEELIDRPDQCLDLVGVRAKILGELVEIGIGDLGEA